METSISNSVSNSWKAPFYQDNQRNLYSFPLAAATNYNTLGGLKQYVFILIKFWKSKFEKSFTDPKSRCWQVWTPSRSSRGKIQFLAFSTF
jgi:hypothetical protein